MPQTRARGAQGTGEPARSRRGGGPAALADSLRKITKRALGSRSRAEQSLILDWPSIVGDEVAAMCIPKGMTFPQRERRVDGTLALTVRSGQATRLQHLEPQVIERVNGYLGYRAVARLRLQHGARPVSAVQTPSQPADRGPPATDAAGPGEAIADPALRAALARLGRAVKPKP